MSDKQAKEKRWSSRLPALKTITRYDGVRMEFQFDNGVLVLADPKKIKAFEQSLDEMSPAIRSAVKTVDELKATQLIADHKKSMVNASQGGTSTGTFSRDVKKAAQEIADGPSLTGLKISPQAPEMQNSEAGADPENTGEIVTTEDAK